MKHSNQNIQDYVTTDLLLFYGKTENQLMSTLGFTKIYKQEPRRLQTGQMYSYVLYYCFPKNQYLSPQICLLCKEELQKDEKKDVCRGPHPFQTDWKEKNETGTAEKTYWVAVVKKA